MGRTLLPPCRPTYASTGFAHAAACPVWPQGAWAMPATLSSGDGQALHSGRISEGARPPTECLYHAAEQAPASRVPVPCARLHPIAQQSTSACPFCMPTHSCAPAAQTPTHAHAQLSSNTHTLSGSYACHPKVCARTATHSSMSPSMAWARCSISSSRVPCKAKQGKARKVEGRPASTPFMCRVCFVGRVPEASAQSAPPRMCPARPGQARQVQALNAYPALQPKVRPGEAGAGTEWVPSTGKQGKHTSRTSPA